MQRVFAVLAIALLCLAAGVVCLRLGGLSGAQGIGVSGGTGPGYEAQALHRNDRVFLVLAANGCSGSGAGGGSLGFRGQFRALDGRGIDWSCRTRDGVHGSVKVDGQRFDLSKGGLLLVSTDDRKTRVDQVAVDLTRLQVSRTLQGPSVAERLQALGDTEPRIAEFLRSSQAAERR